jgi:hypothetical protein
MRMSDEAHKLEGRLVSETVTLESTQTLVPLLVQSASCLRLLWSFRSGLSVSVESGRILMLATGWRGILMVGSAA